MPVSWRHRLTALCASFLLLLLGASTALAEPVRNAVNAIDADVLFMRHALAPGFGDPAHFRIEDCKTQRNLDDEGRAQARTAPISAATTSSRISFFPANGAGAAIPLPKWILVGPCLLPG